MLKIDQLKQRLDCKEEEFDLPSFKHFSEEVYGALSPLRKDLESLYRSSKNPQVRINALEALKGYLEQGAGLDFFLQALNDPDDRVKEKAAEVIPSIRGEISDRIIETLITCFMSPTETVRDAGVKALSLIGKKSVPFLIHTLRNKQFQRKQASMDLLVTLDWIIINNKDDGDMIQTISEGVYSAFQDNIDPSFFWKAGDTLGDHIGGERGYKKLIRLLKDPRPEVRASACHGLGHTKMEKAVPMLLRHLQDKSSEVRREAIVALGELRSQKAVGKLIKALDDPDERVRGSAAFALGLIGEQRAVKPLAKLLTAKIKKEAAIALAYLGDGRSVDILIQILRRDSFKHPRYHQAIKALGFLGDKRAVDPLLKILTHEKKYPPSIIHDVLQALQRMNFSIYD